MRLEDVSVVILCHNRLDEVELNVPPRIDDIEQHGLELVVVDNASNDGSREYLERLAEARGGFTLVVNERNLGVGAGRNSGWQRTTRSFVITLDEDTRISTEQLASLVDELRSRPDAGIVTPVVVHPEDGRLQTPVLDAPRRVTNFHGACYAIRREVFETVGVHDPDCDFGGEELDLSIRVRSSGWDVIQHPELRVAHNSRRRNAPVDLWRRERWTRNHARVMWRWFPYPQAFALSGLNLGGQLRASVRRRRVWEHPRLIRAWIGGAIEGIRTHEPVTRETVDFYSERLGLGAQFKRRQKSEKRL
jgi:GT2 family glycosyltransferase